MFNSTTYQWPGWELADYDSILMDPAQLEYALSHVLHIRLHGRGGGVTIAPSSRHNARWNLQYFLDSYFYADPGASLRSSETQAAPTGLFADQTVCAGKVLR